MRLRLMSGGDDSDNDNDNDNNDDGNKDDGNDSMIWLLWRGWTYYDSLVYHENSPRDDALTAGTQ